MASARATIPIANATETTITPMQRDMHLMAAPFAARKTRSDTTVALSVSASFPLAAARIIDPSSGQFLSVSVSAIRGKIAESVACCPPAW